MDRYYCFWVYILECADGSYYTGVTNNLVRRMDEHTEGYDPSCYTHSRRPLILRYEEQFHFITHAIAREKQIKGWSHAKKQALINGDLALLQVLSKSKSAQQK